ncbi:MAG: hypothetical protein ACD_38C00043G0004 [uncultured bacterium]|uniref:UDP-N-acetylenolpyruvoylglucosamine reductase n=1 Tax=Candidatus Daviesbacteria bacterium GW2011_GWC2_40_12 TaxID=1618431 RepID=A0A0G0T4H3_9BACT|nr:MAG: hypothetical protein ACD_38C00043G0004 [uncultured bacterium]KKQ81887.1 MAG: UDP-N-acetylenolpyruvoylglucosamine reductase [Candidatus Daviesbacteria bacterium GW2011_GWF2_38_7]KKR15931.1 MAG: UDP-N-acetylenolpyruvoylglucosamine reductase [Candidatus Daviesbacteria bacterium GW2011_GWA2_39_33]KKR25372.1 MAG: UDP-N-acetylenolpyruvoylglucosamine reductase [Candidatus Daviesbacteria bacterium GW2011_GWB1_39_5]KKR42020.1 MAG: UDP-N-acetylenolpyruvoylglucosamine reductase [Candidatus Daviesb
MQLQDNYPLKDVTTLRLGGPAKKFVRVKTEEDLIEAIKYARETKMPYLVIGGGSNLLVSDEGFAGLVIKNEITGTNTSKVGPDSFEVNVKSGTPLQELIDYTIQKGLSGLQKLTGIPGTVGGAVYGNAGAYGQSISDHLVTVTAIDPSVITDDSSLLKTKRMQPLTHTDGSTCLEDIHTLKCPLTKEECQFSYRGSIFKKIKYPILEVTFQFEQGDPHILQQEADEIKTKRLVKYPPGIKCPGCFFKNIVANTLPKDILDKIPPEKIVYDKLPAGALLEMVGAKGQRIDGIRIAEYHANLFINDGGNAKTFYNLAKIYALKVKEKFNITLDPEIQLINLPPLI